MSKRTINPASSEQLAEIQILSQRYLKLKRQTTAPFSMLITMAVPFLLCRYGMQPGSFLHQYYLSSLMVHNPENYLSVLQFNTPLSGECISAFPRQTTEFKNIMQKNIANILAALDQFIIQGLKIFEQFQKSGIDTSGLRCLDFLGMEAMMLDDKHLSINFLGRLIEYNVIVSNDQYIRAKRNFFNVLRTISLASSSTSFADQHTFLNSIQENLHKTSAKQLVKWIQAAVAQLLDDFNRSEDLIAAGALNSYDVAGSVINGTYYHIVWITILASVLARIFLLNPSIFWAYRKITGIDIIKSKTLLSKEDAIKEIKNLRVKNAQAAGYANLSWSIFEIILPLLFLLIATYFYLREDEIAVQLFVPGLCLIGSGMGNIYEVIENSIKERMFRKNVSHINTQFNQAVADVPKSSWRLEKGKSLEDSYMTFPLTKRFKEFPFLHPTAILEVIASHLAFHKVKILAKESFALVVQPRHLNDDEIKIIRQKINTSLDRINKIKILKSIIIDHLRLIPDQIIEMRKLNPITRQLTAEFIVQTPLSESLLPQLLFERCLFRREKNDLVITLADDFDWSTVRLPEHQESSLSGSAAPSAFDNFQSRSDSKYQIPEEKRKLKTRGMPATKQESTQTEKPARVIRWPGGYIYDEKNPGPVKPFDHPIFSQTQFSFFGIPKECLPGDLYSSMKGKVEESKMATASRNSQGFQWRHGVAQSVTGKTFTYDVRAKFCGKKGDIRLFAEPIETQDSDGRKVFLHVFNSVEFHSH